MTYGSLGVEPQSPLQPLLEDRATTSNSSSVIRARRSDMPNVSISGSSRRPVLKTIVSKRNVTNNATASSRPDPHSQQQSHGISTSSSDQHSQRNSKSFVYTMLNPRSSAWQAKFFKWFMTMVIVADLCGFVLSTEPGLSKSQQNLFSNWEAVTSYIFLTEYILRFLTVTESHKYGSMGPILGRLRYCMTPSALIDLVATAPYFLERFTGWDLPTLTYLRSFRLLRILKTESFSEASKSVYRVFKYNSEILYVALCIGVGMVLFTSVLMYYLRPKNHEQFESLPATIYLSTLMLTGQGGPDGQLPWYTSAVVLLTGVFSIGMFAIPASMLTWGFEGEAERLARLRWQKATGQFTRSQADDEVHDDWSYSSEDYSTDEEYLNTIAGADGDDGEDEEERMMKEFQLADVDGSGNISLGEFIKLSRNLQDRAKNADANLKDFAPRLAARLDQLEKKVEENNQTLRRLCELLEAGSKAKSV